MLERFGPWVVLCFFLIWWVTNGSASEQRATHAEVTATREGLDRHAAETNFYLHALCVNAAKDDAQRANCIPPPPRETR